ncbi:unnamed protein product [Cercospora beticola]|nr:unnamed protein product [Cercospora beticola]
MLARGRSTKKLRDLPAIRASRDVEKLTHVRADDFAAVMEAAFAWHDHSPEWTENAELNEHRKAVERLLSVEEQVVEATDLQPESFFELAFDGE